MRKYPDSIIMETTSSEPVEKQTENMTINVSGMYFKNISVIPKYISVRFEPEPDITTYELAKLMPYLVGVRMGIAQDEWNKMGSEKRHLKSY